ncbi:hypothetical protein Dimus_013826 [Dionaea muscipula]
MERSRNGSPEASLLPTRNSATAGTTTTTTTATTASAARATTTIPPNGSTPLTRIPRWPTIDGPLGLSEEESLPYARRFFKFGFLLLPWLWAVNCFYFWPVLRHSPSFPTIHPSLHVTLEINAYALYYWFIKLIMDRSMPKPVPSTA